MISPQLVEVCQGLLTREEVNPERVAQDRRPRESGQLPVHSFFFGFLALDCTLSALHSLGGNAPGGVLLNHIIDSIVSRIQYFLPRNVGNTWQ
jgi:hypothetical protein